MALPTTGRSMLPRGHERPLAKVYLRGETGRQPKGLKQLRASGRRECGHRGDAVAVERDHVDRVRGPRRAEASLFIHGECRLPARRRR
jgi:hypothetical protein